MSNSSTATARKILDDIASTEPIDSQTAIRMSEAYASLAIADADLAVAAAEQEKAIAFKRMAGAVESAAHGFHSLTPAITNTLQSLRDLARALQRNARP